MEERGGMLKRRSVLSSPPEGSNISDEDDAAEMRECKEKKRKSRCYGRREKENI